MREPFFSLYRGDVEVSAGWADLIISAEITDEDGGEGDKLMIELDDRDGQIELPETGDIVRAVGGYRGEQGVREGEFEIDQIDVEGWPQKVILHGTSAGAKQGTKERRSKSFQPPEYNTYGDIFDYLAKQNSWKARITDDLRNIPLRFEAQQEESDMAFATRLAEKHDHLATVKDQNLICTSKAEGKSVSGSELPAMRIAKGENLLKYRASWKSKPKHGKVEGRYFDRDKAKDETIEEGDGDTAYRFREPFASKEEAEHAVKARKRELERGEASASFDTEGNVDAGSQVPVEAANIRARLNGRWNPKRVTHRWSAQGYTNAFECETPGKKSSGKKKGSGEKEPDPYWDDDPAATTPAPEE